MNILEKVAIEGIAVQIAESNLSGKVAIERALVRNASDGWTVEVENHTGGYTRYENVTVSAEHFQRAIDLVKKWNAGVYVNADDPMFDEIPAGAE